MNENTIIGLVMAAAVIGLMIVAAVSLLVTGYIKLFGHRHKWGYKAAEWSGELTGKPRQACLRRKCKDCETEQEIDQYSGGFYDGDRYFFTNPQWVDVKSRED